MRRYEANTKHMYGWPDMSQTRADCMQQWIVHYDTGGVLAKHEAVFCYFCVSRCFPKQTITYAIN